MRKEATANLFLVTRVAIQVRVGEFVSPMTGSRELFKQRCRTTRWAWSEELIAANQTGFQFRAQPRLTKGWSSRLPALKALLMSIQLGQGSRLRRQNRWVRTARL